MVNDSKWDRFRPLVGFHGLQVFSVTNDMMDLKVVVEFSQPTF